MTVFVDTGAWVALASARDEHHAHAAGQAARFKSRAGTLRLVTTEAVLDETVTLLRMHDSHRTAVAFLDHFERSLQAAEVVYTDSALRVEAIAIFRKAADQAYSFTDCVSFAVMRRMGLQDAFTFDAHFAGFGFTMHPGSA